MRQGNYMEIVESEWIQNQQPEQELGEIGDVIGDDLNITV